MTNHNLTGITVLNTRPVEQAESLATLIKSHGGINYSLPCIEIQPHSVEHLKTALKNIQDYHYAIFLSANAVNSIMPLWPDTTSIKIFAIGSGTAKAIQNFNIHVDYLPLQMNSEGLLELEVLTHLNGKKIIIFCGENPRPLLAEQLQLRGASISYCHCYQRISPKALSLQKIKEISALPIDIIISTSLESLNNLYVLLGESGRAWLLQQQLLVISSKMAELAQRLGFSQNAFIANNASNEAIVDSLLLHYSAE